MSDARDAYRHGFIDGLRAYAWWKDGEQQVGTTGRTLKEAIKRVEDTWNYLPPPAEAEPTEEDFEQALSTLKERLVAEGHDLDELLARGYAAMHGPPTTED